MLVQTIMIFMAFLATQLETTFTVEYAGKKYEFHISDQDFQKTPAWAPGQENPPLSVRRAIDIATRQITTILPNGKDWRLYEVTLRPIENRWVYLVQFLEPLRGAADRQLSAGFQVVVLMSGQPVTPKVTP